MKLEATADLHTSRLTQGVTLMILAMLTIPIVDGQARHLSVNYSPLFLGWGRYAVASAVVWPYALKTHGPRIFPACAATIVGAGFIIGAGLILLRNRKRT